MPARTAAITLTLLLTTSTAAASCPRASDRDAAACDGARPNQVTTALCAADARTTETCADDPAAPLELGKRAKRDEQLARAALR